MKKTERSWKKFGERKEVTEEKDEKTGEKTVIRKIILFPMDIYE